MKPAAGGAWQGVLASLLLHLAVAGVLLYGMSSAMPARLPVIDLSLHPPFPSGAAGTSPRPDAAPARPSKRAAPAAVPPPAPVREALREEQPALPSPPPPAASFAATPVPSAADPPAPAAPWGPSSSPESGSRPGGASGPGGPGPDSAPHSPPSGVPSTVPGYEYLREAIQREASYPAVARKRGWEGRVVVAFVILPDGAVRDVRVVRGSGHAVLDRSAVEAVRSASPFPRPPAEAEVITPVVYRLE